MRLCRYGQGAVVVSRIRGNADVVLHTLQLSMAGEWRLTASRGFAHGCICRALEAAPIPRTDNACRDGLLLRYLNRRNDTAGALAVLPPERPCGDRRAIRRGPPAALEPPPNPPPTADAPRHGDA